MKKIIPILVVSMFLLVSLSVFPTMGIKVEKNDSQLRHDLIFEFEGLDTYVSHQYPEENYGYSKVIRISNEYGVDGSPGWANVAYIRFWDLINLGGSANIVSAELNFYYDGYENTNPEGRELNVYRVTENWGWTTITWNSQPSYNPEPIASAKVPSSTGKWITWDVTSDIRNFVNEWPPYYHQGYRISDDSYWGESDIPTTMVRSVESDEESFRPYLLVISRISRVSTSQQSSQQSMLISSVSSIDWINGPSKGRPGVEYTFSTVIPVDPPGDGSYIMWDWDDGTELTWDGPYPSGMAVSASHTWNRRGDYHMQVKFKNAASGEESDWSPFHLIEIRWLYSSESSSQQSSNPLFFQILQRLMNI